MYLVGTAEVPLAAYHSDEILEASSLPRRYVGYSPCYRREAGSGGRDTRGIFRVHWFDKVEMFSYSHPDDAVERARAAARLGEAVLRQPRDPLPRHRRRVRRPRRLGRAQVRHRGVGAVARSATARSRRRRTAPSSRRGACGSGCATTDGVRPLATLNGTLVAITRTIVALLENHQQADGSVRVPVGAAPLPRRPRAPHAALGLRPRLTADAVTAGGAACRRPSRRSRRRAGRREVWRSSSDRRPGASRRARRRPARQRAARRP